jgi:hypothetical protein
VEGAHLHVARRDNPNQAWAKSRQGRVVPLDGLVIRTLDTYELERAGHPDALNELLRARSR